MARVPIQYLIQRMTNEPDSLNVIGNKLDFLLRAFVMHVVLLGFLIFLSCDSKGLPTGRLFCWTEYLYMDVYGYGVWVITEFSPCLFMTKDGRLYLKEDAGF